MFLNPKIRFGCTCIRKGFLCKRNQNYNLKEIDFFKSWRNDNAYKLDFSSTYDNVSATFNVVDLSLFDVGDLRTNSFKEEGNNRDQDVGQTVIYS